MGGKKGSTGRWLRGTGGGVSVSRISLTEAFENYLFSAGIFHFEMFR
jgi:hypothetical protein